MTLETLQKQYDELVKRNAVLVQENSELRAEVKRLKKGAK